MTLQTATKELFAKLHGFEGVVTRGIIKQFYPQFNSRTSWTELNHWLVADVNKIVVKEIEVVKEVEVIKEVIKEVIVYVPTTPASTKIISHDEDIKKPADIITKIDKTVDEFKKSFSISRSEFKHFGSYSVETKLKLNGNLVGYLGYDETRERWYSKKSNSDFYDYSPVINYCVNSLIRSL